MPDLRVYVTRFCPYCGMVKRLLTQKGVQFDEIDVSDDFEKRAWLRQASGQTTVPQVFVDGVPYGGFRDLVELDRQGKLDAVLGLTG